MVVSSAVRGNVDTYDVISVRIEISASEDSAALRLGHYETGRPAFKSTAAEREKKRKASAVPAQRSQETHEKHLELLFTKATNNDTANLHPKMHLVSSTIVSR